MSATTVCKLALEDGTVFTGVAFGAHGTRAGEVVFNTSMTGYQEILTDPSYCGQIVTMTFPLVGNYGVNPEDLESAKLHLSGFVVKELAPRPSNYRSTRALSDYLREHDVMGLAGIDTRALTRRTREHGALRGVLSTEILDDLELVARARASESMEGANLVPRVIVPGRREWTEPLWPAGASVRAKAPRPRLVALDCGIKLNILRHLAERGAEVTVVPGGTPAAEILALAPDGVVVGNGPGDPAAVADVIAALRGIVGKVPVFGICLGHQLLALALGATTYKLRFGHHGANVPVLDRDTGRVQITSQNHGFAVDTASLERLGATATHVNLNDGSLEGFAHTDLGLMAVQFHPEASPGPHDASELFDRFLARAGGDSGWHAKLEGETSARRAAHALSETKQGEQS
jgi:carbamoyl-phosphate synthase small subunit